MAKKMPSWLTIIITGSPSSCKGHTGCKVSPSSLQSPSLKNQNEKSSVLRKERGEEEEEAFVFMSQHQNIKFEGNVKIRCSVKTDLC